MRQSRRVTRKKVDYTAKDSEDEEKEPDFEDSGSEASINDENNDDDDDSYASSGEDFTETKSSAKKKMPLTKRQSCPKIPFKSLKKVMQSNNDVKSDIVETTFSVKNLTEQEKLLPDFLNLSESDSDSETEGDNTKKYSEQPLEYKSFIGSDNNDYNIPGSSNNINDELFKSESNNQVERLSESDSDEDANKDTSKIAEKENAPKKLHFENIREHNKKLDEVKKTLELYNKKHSKEKSESFDVGALLAIGETSDTAILKPPRPSLSDSDDEDLEEVQGETNTAKTLPKGGIQVTVDLPSHIKKKSKAMDLEMILKRRINRVKKEYQIYMHQVHILCWIAHGNYLNKILNDMELMAASLSLVPSEQCYPNNRISIKYLEQISKWYCEALDVKEDKNELKYKPNKTPLNLSLLQQISKKKFTTRKSKVYIFICLLRALGVKCRLVLNFRVVPLKPPVTELCSLSAKKSEKKIENSKFFKSKSKEEKQSEGGKKSGKKTFSKAGDKIPQLDGADDVLIKKEVQTRSKKLSLQRNNRSKEIAKSTETQNVANTSGLSYWDQITQNSNLVQNNRVSHRDIKKSKIENKPSVESTSSGNSGNRKKQSPNPTVKSVNTKLTSRASTSNSEKSKNKKIIKNQKVACDNSSKNDESERILDQVKPSSSSNGKSAPVKRKASNENSVKSTRSKRAKPSLPPENDNCSPKKRPNENLKTQSVSKISKSTSEDTNKRKSINSTNFATNVVIASASRSVNKNKTIQSSHDDQPTLKNETRKKRSDSNASDADFLPPKKKIAARKSENIDRRVLSTDSEHSNDETKKKGLDVWCEVYVEEEEQWIAVDIIKGQVHCVSQIYSRASHPVSYVFTWDTNNYVKDVTRRYVPHWNTTTRKLRTNSAWCEAAIRPWMAPAHLRDRREDDQLDRLQLDAPIPQTVSEFKNHPLYVLKRHLLKFEALYPPDPAILGFVRKEAVYARECVHTCRSRETWVKEAKVVRAGEQPYKIVKARPKYDKLSGQMITDIPLEVFGPWQVDDYVPPIAENGVVPRNPYGNVELFKPCMLPGGTVHITLPGLNKVAKKLGIDCAPAMIGFDYHSGGSHPMYDGYVVCEEFKETIIEAWEQEQVEAERRAREKIEKRVYGNWKRIIRGLYIRERLQAKYDFILEPETSNSDENKSKKK